MAKRFTETEKWNKKFIRSLPPNYKLFFLFLLDECSVAGIWDVDIDVAQLKCGVEIIEEDALQFFAKKVLVIDDGKKWFIPDFVEFQYGGLNPNNRAHQKAINQLKKFALLDENFFVKKGLCEVGVAPMVMVMVKEEDKEVVEEKDAAPNFGSPVAQVSMMALLNVEDCLTNYINNNSYAKTRELLCMKNYLSPEMLFEWASAFTRELISRGDLGKTMQDFVSHFNNWLNLQDKNKNPKKLYDEQRDPKTGKELNSAYKQFVATKLSGNTGQG